MVEVIGLVQGIAPDSVEEWRVSKSLDKFGWEYIFQASIAGGKRIRGGLVPDFLVSTVPKETCLYVQGPYYHRSAQEQKDEYQQSILFKMDYLVEVVTTDRLETQEESDSTILEIFGRNQ